MPSGNDRSSNVDFDDCAQCAGEVGSGVCSNCEADGGYCVECDGSGRCAYCEGTGRRPWRASPADVEAVREAGPLVPPEEAPDAG